MSAAGAPGRISAIAETTDLVDRRDTRRADTLLVAVSLLAATLTGGVASVLLAVVVGGGSETDAVIAAYSLFLVMTLIAATARTAVVPLLAPAESEPAFRARIADVGGRVSLIGLCGAVLLAVLAPAVAALYAPTVGDSAARTAAEALLILAPGAWLHVHAATASAALTAAGRVRESAVVYLAQAVSLLVLVVPALLLLGALGLPTAMLVSSAVLAGGHQALLRRRAARLDIRLGRLLTAGQWRTTGAVLLAATLPLAVQLQLVVALAGVEAEPGAVTAYAYAYYLLIAGVTATGAALSLGTLASLVERISAAGRRAAGDFLVENIPVALVVLAPFLVGVACFGEPVIELALGGSLGQERVELLMDVFAVLAPFAVANAVIALVWPAALALGEARFAAGVGVAQVAAQIVAVAVLAGDTLAVAAAHSVIGLAALAVLWVRVCRGCWVGAAVRLARALAPVLVASVIMIAVRALAGEDVSLPEAGTLSLVALAGYLLAGSVAGPALFAGLPVAGALARRLAS